MRRGETACGERGTWEMRLEDLDTDSPQENSLALRSLAGAKRLARGWVWQNWIARGVLSLVLGELGVGKSLLATELAAMVTRGWKTLPAVAMRKRNETIDFATEGSEITEGKAE